MRREGKEESHLGVYLGLGETEAIHVISSLSARSIRNMMNREICEWINGPSRRNTPARGCWVGSTATTIWRPTCHSLATCRVGSEYDTF